jgi:hypothetical protein
MRKCLVTSCYVRNSDRLKCTQVSVSLTAHVPPSFSFLLYETKWKMPVWNFTKLEIKFCRKYVRQICKCYVCLGVRTMYGNNSNLTKSINKIGARLLPNMRDKMSSLYFDERYTKQKAVSNKYCFLVASCVFFLYNEDDCNRFPLNVCNYTSYFMGHSSNIVIFVK